MTNKDKLVVVTGCFQLFHRGHQSLLERASEYGRIHVLLNSDEGTLKLKDYLAETYKVRKQRLLDTRLVDQVSEFYIDPTVKLRELKPDYVIAGSDHSWTELARLGGCYAKEIIILPRTKGVSSSDLYNGSNQ